MKLLKRIQFGNPILRQQSQEIPIGKIATLATQNLIVDMVYTLRHKKLGVGLAAPQVGKSMALAVISIRPNKHRPKVKIFDLVIINPVIVETYGKKKQMWEGCISAGSDGKADLFAKVPRYETVKLKYLDELGQRHTKIFKGLPAQIIQHEVDHLNGILFVDRVKDTKSYMTFQEYKKYIKAKARTKRV